MEPVELDKSRRLHALNTTRRAHVAMKPDRALGVQWVSEGEAMIGKPLTCTTLGFGDVARQGWLYGMVTEINLKLDYYIKPYKTIRNV